MIIGREPGEGGVQVDDPQVDIHHALLRTTEDGCMVFDLGSATGTKIDDASLAGSPLRNGDVIKLGMAELEFVQEDSS
jgi:pSer/pThr/pTyr-binding forkhead associated (FHA) protein